MARSVLLMMLLFSPAAFAGDLLVAGPVDRVVAAGALVAVVRGEEVRVLDQEGRQLFHLTGDGAPGSDRVTFRRRDDYLLELHGIPDEERDSELAETLIEDEATLGERRAARRTAPIEEDARAPLVAASGAALWIGASQRLWRVESDGRASPAAGLPQRFDHLAAGPGRLLATTGARLWRSVDDGASFEILTEVDGPVRALATTGARDAWATSRQLTWDDGRGATTLTLPSPPHDLRFCGEALLVLHDRGLLVIAGDGSPTSIPLAATAWRIACAQTGPWVLGGARLLVSDDLGRSFAERADLPVAALDLSAGDWCLWVATASGVYCLPPREGPALRVAADNRAWRPAQERSRARWAPLLPRLALAATALISPERRDLRALAYADFSLGAPATRSPTPRRLMAQNEPALEPLPPRPLAPDREAPCLQVARSEAVARALLEPERARSYVSRAGHAAWLPELRVRVERRLGRSESLDLPGGASPAAGPLGLDTVNDVRYEGRATWDLSKLVFSSEEIAAEAQALRMADMRREVESLANRLYFERRRLKMELAPSADARVRRDLRMQELEAELDVLSGGAFGRCLPAPPS